MYLLAVLTGDHINKGFFTRKCMPVLPGQKKLAVIMRFRPYFRGGRKSGFHCTKILWFFTQFAFKNQTVRNVLKFLYKAVNLIFFSLNPFLEALLKYRVKSDNQDSLETVTKDSKNGDKWHKDGLNLRHDTEMRRYNSKLPSATWLPPRSRGYRFWNSEQGHDVAPLREPHSLLSPS